MLRILLSSFLFSVCLGTLSAQSQDSVRLVINSTEVTEEGVFCVDVVAISYPDIAAVQFSVAWDTLKLRFEEVRFGDNPLGLSNGAIGMPVSNNVGVTITTEDLSGITLDSGTVILQVCFTPLSTTDDTEITFDGYLEPEFVQENEITSFPSSATNGTVTIDVTVAVKEPVWASELSVFPNPYTNGPLAVRGNLPLLSGISIVTQEGRTVATFPVNERNLDLNRLPNGVYVLRLESGKEVVTRKVVVRH